MVLKEEKTPIKELNKKTLRKSDLSTPREGKSKDRRYITYKIDEYIVKPAKDTIHLKLNPSFAQM